MKRRDGESDMDLWLRRQNIRSKMEFGVEFAAFNFEPGRSNRSYVSTGAAKRMSAENLEVLKLMKNPRLP